MNLATLLPPIAAATILNVFVFAEAWKAGQVEKQTEVAPWYLSAGIILYGVPLLAFLYLSRTRDVSGGIDIFAATAAAQAFGTGIVWALIRAFVSARDQTWKEGAPIVLVSAFLLFVVVAASLKG